MPERPVCVSEKAHVCVCVREGPCVPEKARVCAREGPCVKARVCVREGPCVCQRRPMREALGLVGSCWDLVDDGFARGAG